MSSIQLYYFHDPMCSWCWGFSSALQALQQSLPGQVGFNRILGGLAPDNQDIMDEEMQEQIQHSWRRIESMIPGVKFNFDYWRLCEPRRSTYASCRAVIAARQQGQQYDEIMTKAIQTAYYTQARNPSLNQTLIEVADEIGLDHDRFVQDLTADSTNHTLMNEIKFSRDLDVESFPSMLLKVEDQFYPIALDYLDADSMLKAINARIYG